MRIERTRSRGFLLIDGTIAATILALATILVLTVTCCAARWRRTVACDLTAALVASGFVEEWRGRAGQTPPPIRPTELRTFRWVRTALGPVECRAGLRVERRVSKESGRWTVLASVDRGPGLLPARAEVVVQ